MKQLLWTLPLALALALTACSPAPTTTVTTGCADAITAVGEAPADDFDAEDAAITASTQQCDTADQYIAAVKANPTAWLYNTADDVNENTLILSACSGNEAEPMCKDAEANGLLD